MATRALDPAYRRATVREFLDMDLGDAKAELVDGMILMTAGGSPSHAAIAANLIIALGPRLRGTGCRPYGSDLAMQTGEASIRFPDVSVYCSDAPVPNDPKVKLLGDPIVVFEVLSPSTASNDQITKLGEYRALAGVQAVVFVDPASERVRLVNCKIPEDGEADWLAVGADLELPMLGITIPHAEIFAQD
jgi:Uma2 family endonuclease